METVVQFLQSRLEGQGGMEKGMERGGGTKGKNRGIGIGETGGGETGDPLPEGTAHVCVLNQSQALHKLGVAVNTTHFWD